MLSFYSLFILFIIILFLHKTITVIALLNLYDEFRFYLNIIEPLFIVYFLYKYNLNKYLKFSLFLILLVILRYWLFNQKLIYYFINKNNYNIKLVDEIDRKSVIPMDAFVWVFMGFSLVYILL